MSKNIRQCRACPKAKREAAWRQPFSDSRRARLIGAALFTTLCLIVPLVADEPRDTPIADEIAALRLLETAAEARSESSMETGAVVNGHYRKLIARHPDSAAARNAYADYLWRQQEFDLARQQWSEALRRDPNDAESAFQLGHCALQLAHTREALEYLQRAVASAPENARFQFAYANALYLFRRDASEPDPEESLRTALSHFQRAAALDPTNLGFARAYAETYYVLKNPDWNAALAAWERVEHLSPDKDFARLHLARINLKLGRKNVASDLLESIQSSAYETLRNKLQRQIETN